MDGAVTIAHVYGRRDVRVSVRDHDETATRNLRRPENRLKNLVIDRCHDTKVHDDHRLGVKEFE